MTCRQNRSIVIVTDIGKASRRDCLTGIFRYAREKAPWALRLLQAEERVNPQALADIGCRNIDGIITTESAAADIRAMLAHTDVPVVAIGSRTRDDLRPAHRVATVRIDDAEIGRFAAERLCLYGRFAACGFVQPQQPSEWARQRADGFCAEFRRRNSCPFFEHGGTEGLDEWLRSLPRPTAILAANDTIAFSVLEAAAAAKLAVPQSVAVVGIDNDTFLCDMAKPPLTSILPDHEDVGFRAAAELDRLMSGGRRTAKPRMVLCRGHRFVERESSRPIAPVAHVIREALSFVRKSAAKGITAADVAKHLGISRRLLDLRFHEFSGQTVTETIRGCQLDHVAHLLRTTRLPIKKITEDCGFANETYPKEIFKRRYKMSMKAWRDREDQGSRPRSRE